MEKSKIGKIVYLYIDNWEYNNEEDRIMFGGHPKPGHIYRAAIDSDGIKIPIIEDKSAPVHGVLISDYSGDNYRWKYNVKEVTEEDIALLDIDNDDLKKIKKWEEIDNEDLKLKFSKINDNKEVPLKDKGIEKILEEVSKQESEDLFIGMIFRILMEYMYSNDVRFLLEIQNIITSEINNNLDKKSNDV